MMSSRPLTLFPIVLLLLLFAGCRKKQPEAQNGRRLPDMQASFAIEDKKPMGMFAAHQTLKAAFEGYEPEVNKLNFEYYFRDFSKADYSRNGTVFCVFARQFYPNQEDVDAMSDFVSNGNTLFIASDAFSNEFLQKFHLRATDSYPLKYRQLYQEDMMETGVTITDSLQFQHAFYHFYFYPLNGQIIREESYPSQQIAKNTNGRPGAILFKHGSGRIIVATNAAAFTNYFLLTRNNYHYLEQLLSYLPEEINSITWDNYYNATLSQRDNDASAFSELLKHEAMRWAFWLTLLLALTWIINGMIRRQRVIEVVKPNENSSVEFGETIGRLYLLRRDNKNIAQKMITYFLEDVRSRHYISTGRLTREFAEQLAAKTGQTITMAEELLSVIHKINIRDHISDMELLELNTLLRRFNS